LRGQEGRPLATASGFQVDENGKLVELSRLAGGLAHEIRNPLSTVNLNLQLLEEDLAASASDPEALRRSRRRLDRLRGEVRHLSDVLDDFLRFARMPRPRRRCQDVNALVEDVVSSCAVDADLLKQAVLNLLINAQQAMPDGGQIMVRTWADGDAVKISIADTGHGMDPETLARIFEPYFSTKREGTGLGLPTVKRIVEEHGGHIEVHSERHRGTSFTLALPCPAPECAAGSEASES